MSKNNISPKKSLFIIVAIVVLIIAAIVVISLLVLLKKHKEVKTEQLIQEDILNTLNIPATNKTSIDLEELRKSLSSPAKSKDLEEASVIDNLLKIKN